MPREKGKRMFCGPISAWLPPFDFELNTNLVFHFDCSSSDGYGCNPKFTLAQPSRPSVSPILLFYIDLHRVSLAVNGEIAVHRPSVLAVPTHLCGMKTNLAELR